MVGVYPEGTTNRSVALVAVPAVVVTDTFPEAVDAGMDEASCEDVAALGAVRLRLSRNLPSASVVGKFVPLIVRAAPAKPIAGVKLVMVGAAGFAATVKPVSDAPVPFGLVTTTPPVVALAGTVTVSLFAVAAVTVAAMPLNVAVF